FRCLLFLVLFFFFFQAEDGIRDFHVTGVQTCALPILPLGKLLPERTPTIERPKSVSMKSSAAPKDRISGRAIRAQAVRTIAPTRSEERRVGKECRSRGSREQ